MSGNARTGSASVLLVGLSFRSAPVPLLERVSVVDSELPKLQLALVDGEVISESLVLSTCNRMEFYTVANAFHSGLDHVVETVAQFSGVPAEDLEPHLYVHYADAAAEHMLNVASGLDSMVVGEQQIIGQLRSAYQSASDTGTVGRTLHDLTQRALRTGKRVHSETTIDAAGASMVSFAVDRGLRILGLSDASPTSAPLAGRRALIIGAGAMASLASTYLGKLGIDHVTVANRTLSRAETLADHAAQAGVSATAVALGDMPAALGGADLVVSATGAVETVVTREHVAAALPGRVPGRPLVLIDLSMPRDIASGAGNLQDVALLNIEQLTTMAGEALEDEAPARSIVAHELAEFLEQQRVQAVVPTVKALRHRAADLMAEELLQLERQTEGMDPAHRALVERSMRRVVDKLLHTPTVQAKKLSAAGQAVTYPDALAALFNLPTGIVDSVTNPQSSDLPSGGVAALRSVASSRTKTTATDHRRPGESA
ncbi:glutamyl-tRNA reductase [Corynebacterium heidelbergense]|uniref:Glutamyl-tRNA reductase n=1 Tax=Corynebacterium heidelbergense TaxID=2055947 RepID=A0A364VEL4_9CORY|nr:glutamyl-tRNA reductase [Corynebacterium heidelbergense]RAV35051.1 glutamyl-tRNA reductase [Corynebacterium heidelbergense]WCZ37397.1 Glutamyl-tRNA reductase [Corynebacterium heidelbergense]